MKVERSVTGDMDTNLAQIIEALASSQPAAPAIHVPGRTTLTYADLGEQIRYVRERLSGWGIQPGDVVAAALPSRPEMAVAIATLPSSCTFAPLDPSLPSEAYAELLTRMKAKAVLVTSREEHAIQAAARVLGIAEIDVTPERDAAAGLFALALARGGAAPAAGNSGDPRLAYILTSSGTTGRSKLVPTEHRAVLCYARAMCDWLDFTPSDVGVHITPVYLGNGLRSGLMNALLAGRSLALLPVADIDSFFASIEEFRPTFLTANFSLFRGILRRASEFRAEVAQSRFRFLRWAGRVDLEDADRLEQLFEAPMLTGLSSTETSRISHDPLPPRRRKHGSVGLPVVNEVALLDDAGNVLPNGGPGEILVRGPMVFRGYLDDHDLTAASFVGDWFRTGDLGRIDEDGYVYFVGRIKDIINRGGEKISPAEIDLAIESLPGVKEAAAFAIPHPSLGEEMVAAVVREENAAIDEAQVVERVRARAGARKVPRRVYFVERLPRTDNGKLRRSALPELLSLEQVTATSSHAPAPAGAGSLSPLEGALAGLWSSLLQVATVGRDDDFFLLGGDSLRGTQLIAHLKTIFGVDLSILSLFGEAATVAGMARAIEVVRARGRAVDRGPEGETNQAADAAIRPRRDRGPVVLAHTQLRMWVLERLNPHSRAYNVAEAHRVSGSIDVTALHESLRAFVQRHEILQSTFALVDDEPRQIVQATTTLDFQCLDLPETSTDAQEEALLTLIDGEEQRGFDFESGPAVRFRLIRLAIGDHVLLRVWHHIVWDGWSMSVADRELSVLYAAFANGREPQLPALPIQYADYAVWQREWLQGEVLDRQLTYWKTALAGVPTMELPTDRPRPPVLSSRGGRSVFDLPAPLVRGLKEVGRREGATLFMTLLTAFQVLLARYSGDEDIVVGTPIAGRRRTELEGLVGFFANTLVLRSDLSGNPRFRELLGRVRRNALAAYAHQDLPFEKLVEELAPPRDLSRNPLFQVLFALQNNPAAALELEGLQVSRMGLPRRNVKFDLSLAVRESADGLRASWEYSTDLFDAATIGRMAGHFQVLLEGIVSYPDQRIGQLPLLTEAERHQLLVVWNDTAADYPRDRCIHQLFEAQAARTPEAVAAVCEDRCLTYKELNARANQLAHHLIALGVGPDVLVGLCLERSLEMMVGLLGILKAGGAYVPLDPSYPFARLDFMLGDAHAPVLLTQQTLLPRLPPFAAHVLCLDRDWPSVSAQPTTDLPCLVTADSLAYVMYTSGSTGTPKGVCIVHRGLVNYVTWAAGAYAVAGGAAVPVHSSLAFDLTVTSLFVPLLAARAVCLLPEEHGDRTLASALMHAGADYSLLKVTPAHLEVLNAQVPAERAPQLARVLVVGGEQLHAETISFWRHHAPSTVIINEYGPTETVVGCCVYTVTPDSPTRGPIPIGRPIANTQLYVLDQHSQPVPVGVTGELCISGDGLARGYLNRSDLTMETFVPHPFSSAPGARIYRTGDRVRYLPDGNIEFIDRVDDQVKIRGFRIELGEIEAVLGEHPAVRQAVVLAREDSPGDMRLVAYVVPVDAAAAEIEPMRALLRERLPDYMRPAAYVLLERLPLTPSGKLDRQSLLAPAYGREERGRTFVPPRDALEEVIAEVWREVLRVQQVGVHDNFFEVGGHSLLATQVVARLSRLVQVDLPLRNFFESPTVSALAATAQQRLGAGAGRAVPALKPVPREGDLPLSFAQQRLWFLDQLLPGASTYNMPMALRLQGPLDVGALGRSVAAVVARHESLRTRVVLRGGAPVQVIDPAPPEVLVLTDLTALAPAAREARAQALAEAHARQPFDLSTGPLFRAEVLRMAADAHVLLVNMHHIASDGWAVGVFHRELAAAYGAFVRGTEPAFAPLPIQYADYAVWQREWLQGPLLAAQQSYWQRQLADLRSLELPTDRPRPPVASYEGAQLTVDLPASVGAALKTLGRREGATLFMTLLAAFQVLLARYSGQDDIAVGTPIAGRRHDELEGLIGFFVNTLVLRSDLSGNPRFRELLARVRDTALGAYMHQDLPFEKLVEELAPARDLSRQPLFQVLFVLQNTPGAPLALEGVAVSRLPRETESAKFDLTLSARESAAGLHLRWEYSIDLFDAATIARLAGHFQVLLQEIVAYPARRIGELPLLTEAERHQLLVAWNDTATDDSRDGCIHQLFEAQAARTPDAVAVICGDRELTYAALNARANQVAHQLQALGVGPEVLVAICAERSLHLIVGLLGILKAGGAYVPLDPSYPPTRLAFMLSDTHAPVLITQQALLAQLPPFDGSVLCLDRDAASIAAQPATDLACRTTAASLAYVIYTSGSTGTPKGILLPHATLVNLMMWHGSGASGGRVAQLTSISFDVSMQEILYALLFGRALIVVDDDTRLQPDRFAAFIQDNAITDLFVPNVVLQYLTQAVVHGQRSLHTLANVYQAGEALTVTPVVQAFFEAHPACWLHNHYGPAESHVVTAETLSANPGSWPSRPGIGSPISNTRIYVLDQHSQPVPVGVTGELCIGGNGLARGYLNRPELTTEKFVPDPFSLVPGARMYRTGDRARYLANGDLEFLGRLDDQVKIRGFRIELGEIEAVLGGHPAVRQAVVLAREDTPGDPRLVAYVVPVDAAAADVEPLRVLLRERLPDYMRPAAYVVLAQLPLTSTGKVDRRALPAPDAAAYASRAYEAPVGPIETTLVQIWADVLRLDRVGRRDNFFELGGHSLLAVSMLERMRQAGLHADVRALFVTPTLAELAAAVAGGSSSVKVPANRIPQGCNTITPDMLPLVQLTPGDIARIAATVAGGAANIQDIYPLAPLQEGILFHHQMSTESDPYSMSTMLAFDSRSRLQRYLGALQAVIDRHDVLRTALLWEGLPEPVQVVWRQAPLVVEEVDLVENGDVVQQMRARFNPRHYRLDLHRAPIMRVFIAHDAANERWVMLRVSHHVLTDGTSMEVVRHEIQAHLLGEADQLPVPLPFRDFVAQAKLGVAAEEHQRFFRNMLNGVSESTTPFGLTDVHGGGSGIVKAERPVDASLARRLRERARAIGVSAASVCHLAWAQVLARLSGRDDVVFGTVLFGRMQGGSGADRVLGLCINTLPLRIRVGDEGVQSSVRRTHELLAQLLRHEHAPLALAQRCSAVPPPAPLFSALLNYRHKGAAARAPEATLKAFEGIVSLPGHGVRTNYPLKMAVNDLGKGLSLSVQAQTPIDAQRVCAFMHTALEQLVGALESAPTTPLRRIDVLPASERALLPDPTIPIATPTQPSVVAQVLGWAHATPDGIAVRAAGKQWTYAELTGRARSLATALQGLGVGRGDVVAIIGPRSFGLVGAMLGVLMSGGAFLTIDPALPTRRKRVMLAEARAKAVCAIGQSHGDEDLLGTDDTLAVLRTDVALTSHVVPEGRPEQAWSLPAIHGDDPAYVFFTSGSTGQPKAILGCHKGLSHFLQWQRGAFAVGVDDRVSQLIGLTFDPLLRDVFLPLTSGATICVPTDSDLLDTLGWMQREGVTVVHTTPTVMQSWLLEGERRLDLPSLRWVFVSGEPLTDVLIGRWRRIISGPARLVNFYGPTETTMIRCFYIIPAELTPGVQPIGGPLPDSQALVLNAAGLVCAIGEIGEIVLRTPFRTLGYLNLPEETLRHFRPNPFRDDARDVVYFTGDRGRYRPDGLLEIAGRVDDQVKIQGVRIDPGEVTATLARHEAIRHCVVVGRDDEHGQPQLVGYVASEPGKHVDARELRVYLSGQLPQAFVPVAFVFLDALPVLPNGKIDRRALPAPQYDRGAEADPFLAPRDALEELIAEVWREVLRVEQVGVHDNFFELGGHSLLATQVVARISRLLQVELPLRRMFEAPTIAGLASALARILGEIEAPTDEEAASGRAWMADGSSG